MKELKFRNLKASEVECRIATVKYNVDPYKAGVQILLYKDARVDQRILDETVGAMNWQRHHSRDNANCTISIWDDDKKQWIEKEDTGTESFTEKEKGLASDSFKRAAFNWGIGRELYSAPFVWVNGTQCTITNEKKCYEKFKVSEMTVEDGEITAITVVNSKNTVVFQMGKKKETDIGEVAEAAMMVEVKRTGVALTGKNGILAHYNVDSIRKMSPADYRECMDKLKAMPTKRAQE